MRPLPFIATLAVVPMVSLAAQGQRAPSPVSRSGAALSAEVRAGMETITATDMQRRIEIIADDSMGGRDTPSRGLDATAKYIASEFGRLGLTPGGDGGEFIQRYPIPGGQNTVRRTAPNVVGILEGSDPTLKSEYIV